MTSDPLGYYARLGVAPDSAPAELKAAFRRQARRLHPDAPGTGDAAGFVRLKEAYDVLVDPHRRAAYHRAAGEGRPVSVAPEGVYPHPRRGPWLAGIGAALVAVTVTIIAVRHAPSLPAPAAPPARAVAVASPSQPLALAGSEDHYVTAGNGPAVVWRAAADGTLSRMGTLTPFTAVHASSQPAPEGLAGVALVGGMVGFVDAARLMAGDAAEARRASCVYFAGGPPANGEVLGGAGHGNARVTLTNFSPSPAVVTLRDAGARDVARVYLAPRGAARLAGLPAGPWTAEVAFGELWSRACNSFMAGERVLRAPTPVPPDGTLTIGPTAPDH